MIFNSTKRKPAETFTYLLSILVVGSILSYLAYGVFTQTDSEYLEMRTSVSWERSKILDGKRIVPVMVTNNGHRSPAAAIFNVTYSEQENETFEVTYLGRGDSIEVYLSIPQDIQEEDLKVTLHHYQF